MRIAQQQGESVAQGFRVAIGNRITGHPILHKVAKSSHLRGDHRRAAGHRLQRHHPKRLIQRWHHQRLRRGIIIWQGILPAFAEKDHHATHAQLVAQFLQARHFSGHVFGGHIRLAADDCQMHGAVQAAQIQAGHRMNQRIHAFQRFDAPHKQHHAIFGFQADGLLCFTGRDGIEMTRIHARRNGNQFTVVCTIEETQLCEFCQRGDDDPIRPTENLPLAFEAIGPGAFILRTRHPILHLAQGMEHVHDGSPAPGIAQRLRRQPGHPIVAVDHVVLDSLFGGKLFDSLHKFGDVFCNIALALWLFGPGRDMHHAIAESQFMNHVRHVFILRAGEHIHMDSHPPQFARQIADINIHPAGILAPEGGQGTGMIGKHCNTKHNLTNLQHTDNAESRKLAGLFVILYNPAAVGQD